MEKTQDIKIYCKSPDVWDCFQKNKEALSTQQALLCENKRDLVQIYITEDTGYPLFIVYKRGVVVAKEPAINDTDCQNTYKILFCKFVWTSYQQSHGLGSPVNQKSNSLNVKTYEDEMTELDAEAADRDEDLFQAMQEALLTILGAPDIDRLYDRYGEDIVEDSLDIFCRALAKEKKLSVYRPTWEREKGKNIEVFVEYPYLAVEREKDKPLIYRRIKAKK